MPDDSVAAGAGEPRQHSNRNAELDLELWKHFAGMGGADKSTMITTVSWLLALAAGALSYIATRRISWTTFKVKDDPTEALVVALVGLILAIAAGYLTLLYGGYANRNWAQADRIAGDHKWYDLLPENTSDASLLARKPENLLSSLHWRVNKVAWGFARPCVPGRKLPFVFYFFGVFATLFGLANMAVIVLAVLVRLEAPRSWVRPTAARTSAGPINDQARDVFLLRLVWLASGGLNEGSEEPIHAGIAFH